MKMLLLIDRLNKDQMGTLLAEGSVICNGQSIMLDDLKENGEFKEPYRTALVLKILGKTTGTLLCALSLIDYEKGTYGRKIGQELGKDDNYIRQLLNIMELIGILQSSEGKGKQRIFTLEKDLVILPRDQMGRLMQGDAVSIPLLISRELKRGTLQLEELFYQLYDKPINCIIHPREGKEKFKIGQLIESMVKSGVVRTFETSSSKRLRYQGFLTFYQLLELLNRVRTTVPKDAEGNVKSSDLTKAVEEELHKWDESGELARRYRNYVHYHTYKQIVTSEGPVPIDFSTLKELIQKKAEHKNIELSAKMRNLIAENLIASLKGLPITSFTDTFIDNFIDNLLEDRFLITSSEDVMNQVETLMRVGDRSLENAKDIQDLDAQKAKEYVDEASLNYLSLLLLLHGGTSPQKLSLMTKAFLKKKGDQSIFALVVENFSSLRKDKETREKEEFSKVEEALKKQFQAFDVTRFLRLYLRMVEGDMAVDLEAFIEATVIVSFMGKLLFEFRMSQVEG